MLPALLLLACGNSDSAPSVSYDPTTLEDAEVDPSAEGDAGRRPPDPNPVPIGGSRSDGGKPNSPSLDAGTSGGGAGDAGTDSTGDARSPGELGAFNAVERLLVADGKSARVHVLDAQSRDYLDTFSLNAAGTLYAGADGRYGYVLESAQDLVQVISLGLPDPAETTNPTLKAPSLSRTSLPGLAPSAFAAHADQVAVLFAGGSQLATFDEQSISAAAPTHTASVSSVNGAPSVLLHLGDKLIVSERAASATVSTLQVFDDKLVRLSRPDLPCEAPEGAAQTHSLTPTVAIGCADGIMLWNTSETSTKRVPYPNIVNSERAHKLVASPNAALFMSAIGDRLCLVREEISCVSAPDDLIDYAFDASGKRALVLSRDGTLHLLDAETLEKRETISLFSALPTTTLASELPGLAVGRRNIYVSDPSAGRIHIVDSATATESGKIEVPGGFPTQVVVFKYDL